ncbi:MAG: methyltransferase domain-containing protein [Acidocella sp.]|nr:methyltransferase domain-containing protein [Acidocella sp.]
MDGDVSFEADIWSNWLRNHRHGGDADYERHVHSRVAAYVKRVLDGAKLWPDTTMLDIGSGEGAVGFAAIERLGARLQVMFIDISPALLRHAEALALCAGVAKQCQFLQASVERMPALADETMDVVTSRAALAYVADKPAALRECFRVLKPGGRISIGEPMFRDEAMVAAALGEVLAARPQGHPDRLLPLVQRWQAAQFPATAEGIAAHPLTNFSERDLVRFFQQAGFCQIHLELHIDVCQPTPMPWEVFINTSPHPLAPTLAEIMSTRFDAEARGIFEHAMRPTVVSGNRTCVDRMAYVTAMKPHF